MNFVFFQVLRGYLVYQLCSIGPIVENNDKVRGSRFNGRRKLIFAVVQHDPKNAPHCPFRPKGKYEEVLEHCQGKKEGDCFDTKAIDALFLTFVHGN